MQASFGNLTILKTFRSLPDLSSVTSAASEPVTVAVRQKIITLTEVNIVMTIRPLEVRFARNSHD